MKLNYLVQIFEPKTHYVSVKIEAQRLANKDKMTFFLPSWSPGSYLMREYSRHVLTFKALTSHGEVLFFEKKAKGQWEIDWSRSELSNKSDDTFQIEYQVYCHELTVRTSHIDETHAFLHGPSYLMGVLGEEMPAPTIEFRFPPLWQHLTTGLKAVDSSREVFLYTAKNYDELIDAPVEIGCHETDGFRVKGKDHHLAFYGETYEHGQNLKKDFQKIVETVSDHMSGELPYEQYTFISHFKSGLYGGLEHLNSTALHFDGRKLGKRKDYLNWLALVAHEYFHTWNVKRIRPKELGPFDYLNEGYTSMLWLAEGLTSFMDDLFVLRAGLSSLEEYLDIVAKSLKGYLNIPGKKFHSLEMSSYDAWIKLYRPDENSNNSSISYYLKGGIVFNILHFHLKQKGKSVDDLLGLLWDSYLANPQVGLSKEEVFSMVKSLGGEEIGDLFWKMVCTTEDLPLENAFKLAGLELVWKQDSSSWIGANLSAKGDIITVSSVLMDSPAFKGGLNAGDEVIGLNGVRFTKDDLSLLSDFLQIDRPASFLVARLGKIMSVEVIAERAPRELAEIKVIDRDKALGFLMRETE